LTLTDEEFGALVDAAIERIPPPFSDRLDTVAIVVEDEPNPGQVPPGSVLFGLYQGVPRTTWGVDNVAWSNKISIFKGPLERHYRSPEALAEAVVGVVFHEVAHHFGISDGRLRELDVDRRRLGG
jgi:predicted Zn-dependent protease with MMP-like domain